MLQLFDVYFQLHYPSQSVCLLESILCLSLLKQAPLFYLPGNDDKQNDIKSGDLHHLLSFLTWVPSLNSPSLTCTLLPFKLDAGSIINSRRVHLLPFSSCLS